MSGATDEDAAGDSPEEDAPAASDGALDGELVDAGAAESVRDAPDDADAVHAAAAGPRRLDFADPGRRPELDALVASAGARLASELSRELGTRLRFSVSCTVAAPGRRSGADVADALAPGASCTPLTLESPTGGGWLLIERALVSALADRRYGGTGRAVGAGRPPAPSERRLDDALREALRLSLERAWRPVTALVARAPNASGPADDVARARLAATDELWHECTLRVRIDGASTASATAAGDTGTDDIGNDDIGTDGRDDGEGAVEEPGGDTVGTCSVLIAHSCIAALAPRPAAPVVHRPAHAHAFGDAFAAGVRGCDVELVGVLAEQRITLGKLAALRAGDFIALDERRPVRFRTGGRTVFDARMGLDDGRVSASVTRLHGPLRDGEHGE